MEGGRRHRPPETWAAPHPDGAPAEPLAGARPARPTAGPDPEERAGIPPMVAVVGKKKSGKTTVAVRLIAELDRRGWRVMSIKHGHAFDLDREGRDTWRHRHEGGSRRVVAASPGSVAVLGDWPAPGTPLGAPGIAGLYLSDADVVVVEGFKGEPIPRIEVFRREAHATPVHAGPDDPVLARYLAVVTDDPTLRVPCPVLDLADPGLIPGLADLVEARVIRGDRALPAESG